MMVCLPSCNIDRPIYIWRIESQLWQFYKRYPHLSPHLQIRPFLVHPYLPQPRAPPLSLYLYYSSLFFYNKSNSTVPSAARPAEHASSPPSSPTESFIGVGVEKKLGWWWWCAVQCTGILLFFFAYNSKHHVDTVFDHFTTMLVSLLVVSRCKL